MTITALQEGSWCLAEEYFLGVEVRRGGCLSLGMRMDVGTYKRLGWYRG